MKRRQFVFGLSLLPIAGMARADDATWTAKLLQGGFEGADFWAGLYITLSPGWKTYWRVPGEAGIPPQIKVEGGDVSGIEVQFPVPMRIEDPNGEAIGYHNAVMFPLRIATKKTAMEIAGDVTAFFGVCQDICKPAQFSAKLADAAADAAFIKKWRAHVPVAGSIATAAHQDKDKLTIKLTQPVDDIFVEGPEELYFRKPDFSTGSATFKIDGLAKNQKLKGQKLKFTAVTGVSGLEQVLTVA